MNDSKAGRSSAASIAIIGVLFFIFGFVTWLNGTLIPFLKLACDLQTDAQALLVTFAFYMAYFFLAIPSSMILRKTGYKKGMSLGLFVMAGGALLFLPAASSRNFWLFLSGLFVQGMGLSLLQTASNPYVIIIGPRESAARRISIMGICNKVAGALAPLLLGAILLKDAGILEAQITGASDAAKRAELLADLASRVVLPYILMAGVLFFLGLAAWFSSLPEIEHEEEGEDKESNLKKTSIFSFPHLLLGVLGIFLYVGAEVMAGDVIGPYGRRLGLGLDETKNFTSYTLWSMVAGYCVGIFAIPGLIKQEKALTLSALIAIVFAFLAFLTEGRLSILFIALLGFANSLMWPAIFPLAIAGLGKFTRIGSALLIMGIAGGAVLPQVYARLAQNLPASGAFLICVLPCYLYILYYALKGHLVGRGHIAIKREK